MYRVVQCSFCGKYFERTIQRYNESIKFGWKLYCSLECHSNAKSTKVKVKCARSECDQIVYRDRNQFLRYKKAYCSSRCVAHVVNLNRIKKIRICPKCNKKFFGYNKYCSIECIPRTPIKYSNDFLIVRLKTFYEKNQRIPTKRDFVAKYHSYRRAFGTWNNAIKAAGFEPNPVLFAKKYIANDGHKCDSLSEKIIDDWLSRRKIKHERSFPYPGIDKFKVDFKIGDYWIEFFGLVGGLRRYEELRKRKINLSKKMGIKLIAIYPKDLFPKGKIEEKLGVLI